MPALFPHEKPLSADFLVSKHLHLCRRVSLCQDLTFSSFGEYARALFAIAHPLLLFHEPWVEKTPITVPFSSFDPQDAMAFQFVDPLPFIPNGSQWVMVPGRSLMNRVVTGRVHKQNNDLGIATFSPLPLEQLDF
jgi:hypothetical protein